MATYGRTIAAGCPASRRRPWPPRVGSREALRRRSRSPRPSAPAAPSRRDVAEHGGPAAAVAPSRRFRRRRRPLAHVARGLPRVPGGEPWPPAAAAPAVETAAASRGAGDRPATDVPAAAARVEPLPRASTRGRRVGGSRRALRRGLPRTPDGEPWPPAGSAPARPSASSGRRGRRRPRAGARTRHAPDPAGCARGRRGASGRLRRPVRAAAPAPRRTPMQPPRRPVAAAAASARPAAEPWPKLYRSVSPRGMGGRASSSAASGCCSPRPVSCVVVRLAARPRADAGLPRALPGRVPPARVARPSASPPWLGWQHFFNVFLIVLIIRSGLQVRTREAADRVLVAAQEPAAQDQPARCGSTSRSTSCGSSTASSSSCCCS